MHNKDRIAALMRLREQAAQALGFNDGRDLSLAAEQVVAAYVLAAKVEELVEATDRLGPA